MSGRSSSRWIRLIVPQSTPRERSPVLDCVVLFPGLRTLTCHRLPKSPSGARIEEADRTNKKKRRDAPDSRVLVLAKKSRISPVNLPSPSSFAIDPLSDSSVPVLLTTRDFVTTRILDE